MSHCPHLNILNPDLYQGGAPHPEIAQQRREQPIYWLDNNNLVGDGIWVLTQRSDIDYVSKNPLLFSSRENTCVIHEKQAAVDLGMQRLQMINMDPPEHVKFRRVVRSVFTPKTVEAYRPLLESIVSDCLDQVCAQGECEFVGDIATVLPLTIMSTLMGIPDQDQRQFSDWITIMLSGSDPDLGYTAEDQANAAMQVYMYASQLQQQFRQTPENNLLSSLIEGEVDNTRLTSDEIDCFFLLLMSGGLETTSSVSSQGFRLLIEHPEQLRYLQQNPERIEDFIEEVLRYNTPINYMIRTAMENTCIGDCEIKQGQLVMMLYHGANHDEAVFKQPERFDVTRPQREDVRNGHRAFGVGQHFCIGSHLARLQLTVLFSELLRRIDNPRFTGEPTWLRSHFLNAIKSMPIAFDLHQT